MKYKLLFLLINKVFSLLDILVKIGLPVYGIVQAVPYLAGETTIVSLLFSKGSTSIILPLAFISIIIFWALLERFFRFRKTKEMSARIIKLETMLDKKRTSSGLTSTGHTHKKDKVL